MIFYVTECALRFHRRETMSPASESNLLRGLDIAFVDAANIAKNFL